MIFQIDQLFINSDNITTLSPYDVKDDKSVEMGLIINGVKYALFIISLDNKEEIEDRSKKLIGIANTLINGLVTPVQRLKVQ